MLGTLVRCGQRKFHFSAIFACMTRLRRVVAVNRPHHLTQRGNARQCILNRDQDRAVYLKLRGKAVIGDNVGPRIENAIASCRQTQALKVRGHTSASLLLQQDEVCGTKNGVEPMLK